MSKVLINQYYQKLERALLEKKLAFESKLVRKDSVRVLNDFEDIHKTETIVSEVTYRRRKVK